MQENGQLKFNKNQASLKDGYLTQCTGTAFQKGCLNEHNILEKLSFRCTRKTRVLIEKDVELDWKTNGHTVPGPGIEHRLSGPQRKNCYATCFPERNPWARLLRQVLGLVRNQY